MTNDALHNLSDRIRDAFKPPSDMTLSEWAENYRYLGDDSPIPGRFKVDRVPYMQGPMDACSDRDTERVTIQKPVQVGATEMLLNIVGYYIHQRPATIMLVQPSLEIAESWSKTRFNKMVSLSPPLTNIFSNIKKDSNTIREKTFPGGSLAIAGANSAKSLRSRPVQILLCDETDGYPADADGEGPPVELAENRTVRYPDRLIVHVSTPTIKDNSVIESEFYSSNQQYLWVPCPYCGQEQILSWDRIKWQKSDKGKHLFETATYICEADSYDNPDHPWTDTDRIKSIKKARWIAHNPDETKHAGFWINGIYAPFLSHEEMVRNFIRAKRNNDLKTWTNTFLAETWDMAGEEAIDADTLIARKEHYGEGVEVPSPVQMLTAGIDTQDDRLEVEVVGWGQGYESWGIDHQIFAGDLKTREPWDRLRDYLQKDYLHETYGPIGISVAAIDTGGHYTDEVYEFTRGMYKRGLIAVKGVSGYDAVIDPRPSYPKKRRDVRLYKVRVDTAKDFVMSCASTDKPGRPGYIHIPTHYSDEWCHQLTSERLMPTKEKGRTVYRWTPTRKRNEALDMRVYAYAALKLLNKDLSVSEDDIDDNENQPQPDNTRTVKPVDPSNNNNNKKKRSRRGRGRR